MRDERTGHTPDAALTELRRRLATELARARLSQTQLAAQARLGRTTVSEALSSRKPVPSAETVVAMARVLKLPEEELLELRRTAAEKAGTRATGGPGRPIGEWDPHALEVHPAGTVRPSLPGQRLLSGYVPREHDRVLAEAVREVRRGHSRMLFLVGGSSTGKTRACWEAVQPLAEQGWRLWHPVSPTRAQAALEDLHRVGPRTVVWLNEAQHYFGDRAVGERIAAGVHHLLASSERGPVLVLGTLWNDYFRQYTALPAPSADDPHSLVRSLLAGRAVSVPEAFDEHALAVATALAEGGDQMLADALTRAGADGRLTQDLAGGPALLERYRTASPAARALLQAAMDARRLGVGLYLPQAFLTDAAADYFHDADWNQLTHDWAEKAYTELAEQVHGKQAPLSRVSPRPHRRPPGGFTPADASSLRPAGLVYRLADYLEQHGRTTRRYLCPPASFWYAANTHLTHPGDLDNLTQAAEDRHRLQWAHHLRLRAADYGSSRALDHVVKAEEAAGNQEGAEALAWQAANHGHGHILGELIRSREVAGDRESAEALAQQAADHGNTHALLTLAHMREEAGDREGAEALVRQAADHGNTKALLILILWRANAGDREGAETLAQQAADHGNTNVLLTLAQLRKEAGDREGAEALAQQAADHDDIRAWLFLSRLRVEVGDLEGAEALAWQGLNHGNTLARYQLAHLAELRERAGDPWGAEALARRLADHGSPIAYAHLAEQRERAGDPEAAEALARQAADHGDIRGLAILADMREEAGDRKSAEILARQAADQGETTDPLSAVVVTEVFRSMWPYGLDPDGTPTPRWR
ncbi:helix-turn-helix domain-containing protein [Streptomyces rubradiris]|uniref:helix-turn-helix domain-containing protein n=1 Tax=Streptomyces rubradiris TaxID=285531 RepID=UPI0036EE3C1F